MTTTPPTDTAAALEAALAEWASAVARGFGSAAKRAARDAALTAHVEAEVARRLAAAPEVEAAIRNYDAAAQAEGAALALHRLPTGGDETYAAYTRAFKASEDAWSDLERAIAADKARAVEAATRYTRPAVSAEAAVQLVARFEESIGHEMRRRIGDDRAALIAALTGKDPA